MKYNLFLIRWSGRRGRSLASLFEDEAAGSFPATKTIRRLAVGMILSGAILNEFLLARYLSSDGTLDLPTISAIRWIQAALVVSGISLLFRKRAVLLALFFGLVTLNLSVLRVQVKTVIAENSAVTEDRFRELREALPAEGPVGYISDDTTPKDGYIGTKSYYLTQFAVAPIVVEAGATRDFVIGNFLKFDPHQVPRDLVIVRDFGNGLIVFRKKSE